MEHAVPGPVQGYWVMPGRFLAGEYPAHHGTAEAAERLDALLAAGIDTFVDLTQPDELKSYLPLLERRASLRGVRIHCRRFPIMDLGLPIRSDMQATLDYIDASVAAGRNVYVHCWGGVGRTGLVVGCFLVRHGRTGRQALEQISRWRRDMPKHDYNPHSPETPEQVQFVLDWSEPTMPAPS